MFLTNWLIFQIVAAGVTGAIEYPSAADFFMNFDSNNSLYFTGGSKEYISNIILYKGESEYPVYNGTVSNIYISDPATYVSYIQLCNETYVTNTVDVQGVTQVAVYDYSQAQSTEQKIVASDRVNSDINFGISVAINGDYAIVGAHNEDTGATDIGAAYIYKRNATTGVWGDEQKIQASDRQAYNRFGESVSLSGDYAIVAARFKDTGKGAVYMYKRNATTGVWGDEQKIVASDRQADDYFGYSVSLSGDYAIVAAYLEDMTGDVNNNTGAVYMYKRNASGVWGDEQKIVASDRAASDYFGVSVSLSGDYAIVGASGKDSTTGAAYIYTRNGTTWGDEKKIVASDRQGGDYFGGSVSLSGDYAIVGAGNEDSVAGAAYIYKRNTSTGVWGDEQKIQASDKQGSDNFGFSVSLSGDYAIVGARLEDVTGDDNRGAAYIFKREGTTWSEILKITAGDRQAQDAFGNYVSISGDYAIVGANGKDTGIGAAYIYNAENLIPTLTQDEYNKLTVNSLTGIESARITLNANTYSASGQISKFYVSEPGTYEVSVCGSDAYAILTKDVVAPVITNATDIAISDYNQFQSTEQKIQASDRVGGDSFGGGQRGGVSISGDYAIVGAYNKNSTTGAAYIFTRNGTTGAWSQQKIVAGDTQANDYFGWSVAISGDYAIVGAFAENTRQGAAYIFKRSGTTWSQITKLTESVRVNYNDYAWSVAIDGDYAIVGARIPLASYNGAAYIYTRVTDTTWTEQKILPSVSVGNSQFGQSVAISGDYAIVGSFYLDPATNAGTGVAYIFTRNVTTGDWSQQAKLVANDAAANDYFGWSVSLSGDYAIVGAPYNDDPTDTGSAYIYKRNASTGVWGDEQKIRASDIQQDDNFGWSVAIDGDYAIVGAHYEDATGDVNNNAGAAYIYKRDGTTWSQISKLVASDRQATERFGESVSISGDYVIAGAPNKSGGGAAYIYKAPDIPSPKLTYNTYNTLTLSDILPSYSSTLRYLTKTYDIGSASTIIIRDPGRYEIATTDNERFMALNSNVTDTSVTQVVVYDYTQVQSTERKIQASDRGTGDTFGSSIAISGNYAIVGAPASNSNSGRAYIFTRSGNTWSQQIIYSSEIAQGDTFGSGVGIDGDYAVVGANGKGPNQQGAVGAAYVFKRNVTTGVWSQQAILSRNDPVFNEHYGQSVAISGDYAIVGAWADDPGGIVDAGSAYIFKRSGTSWSQTAYIFASDKHQGDLFGRFVSISGDYVISGSESNGGGAAYIFKRDTGLETWSQQKIQGHDTEGNDEFGKYVSISGDYAIVGAPYDDDAGNASGSAYIFKKPNTTYTITQNPYFTSATNIVNNSNWSSSGWEITSSSVGANQPGYQAFDNTYTAGHPWESTWLSDTSMPAWVQIQYPQDVVIQAYTIVGRDDTDRYYPTSWQLQGATAAAPTTYVNLETTGGNRTASSWAPLAEVSFSVNTPNTAYRYFRLYVNSSNEINQVSINELKLFTISLTGQSGTVNNVWYEQAKLVAGDAGSPDIFGISVSISGDYAVVGASNEDPGGTADAGSAYIFKRSGTTWSQIAKLFASDKASSTSAEFGHSIAIDGGYMIVGARQEDTGATNTGAAYIYNAETLNATLTYDGLNNLALSNVSSGAYNTFFEGSNVLACATDLVTYTVPKSGTYSVQTKSSSVFAFSNEVSIPNFYTVYQYPPVATGTISSATFTASSGSGNRSIFTVSGENYESYSSATAVTIDSYIADSSGVFTNVIKNTTSTVGGQTHYNMFRTATTSNVDLVFVFPSAKIVRKYVLYPTDSNAPTSPYEPGSSTDPTLSGATNEDNLQRPKSWVLYGSADDTTWVSIHTVTNQPPSIYGDVHTISSPASYQYYKLSVSENNGSTQALTIGEWQLWGDV